MEAGKTLETTALNKGFAVAMGGVEGMVEEAGGRDAMGGTATALPAGTIRIFYEYADGPGWKDIPCPGWKVICCPMS